MLTMTSKGRQATLCLIIALGVLLLIVYIQGVVYYQKNDLWVNSLTSFRNVLYAVFNVMLAQFSSSRNTISSTAVSIPTTRSPTSSPMGIHAQASIAPPKLFLTSSLNSRLGNQMFIYANLVGLALAQGREPFLEDGEDLSSLFRVSYIRNDIKTDGWTVIEESKQSTFDSKFTKLPPLNITISGNFQLWRYFQHAQEEIRREYKLKADVEKNVQTTLATYRSRRENNVLVGVHVRRGDFLKPAWVATGIRVANASYFVNAFGKMRSLLTYQNITFLVGSDDLDWCKNNMKDTDIEILPQGSADDHFAILSSCDHTIITGGSFGWWIGWLANGVTIYYKNYVAKGSILQAGFNDPDYYPAGWIGLED